MTVYLTDQHPAMQGGAMASISSAPVLQRVQSAAQMLAQRCGSFQAAAPQPPMFQDSTLPDLAPKLPLPESHAPADLDVRNGDLSNSGSQQFEVTDADMLDALHAITGEPLTAPVCLPLFLLLQSPLGSHTAKEDLFKVLNNLREGWDVVMQLLAPPCTSM